MKEIIKKHKNWAFLAYMRAISVFWIPFLLCFYILSVRDHCVLYEGNGTKIMSSWLLLILFLICAAIVIYVNLYFVKVTSKKNIRKPYRIEIGIHGKDEILSLLNSKLQLEKVKEDCCYEEESIFVWWLVAVKELRVFVFLFEENKQSNGLEIADQYVKEVNELTDFKPAPRVNTQVTTHRNQIFIYDTVPKTVLETAQDNVESDIFDNDILTNFFIDLSEGVLYIPYLCAKEYIVAKNRAYLSAIKQVGKYLDIL